MLTLQVGKHNSNSGGGGIHFYHKGHIGIWVTQDGSYAKVLFELLEGFVVAGTPGQGLRLFSEHSGKGSCFLTEILNETSFEIGKS